MPLKILLLSHVFAPKIGGIETSSQFLANVFTEAGHQVRVMTMTTNETPDRLPYRIIRKPSLKCMVQQHIWADIVFENNPCLRLGYPKFLFRRPSIIVLHTWLNRNDSNKNLLDRFKLLWLSQAKQVITVSNAVQQRCWPSATVIGNSYNDRLFGIRDQERKKDFVFVGRLVSDKGVELAIRAFNSLAFFNSISDLENATLTIIGEGTECSKLKDFVMTLSEPNRVRFMGSLTGEALVNELNRHSFQFIPSIWEEPFGIVALEGIACGLIPIVSDGGGLPDAVGKAGITFKRGQLDSLISVTTNLLNSNELQQQCLKAASDHLTAHSSTVIAKQYLDVLDHYTPNVCK